MKRQTVPTISICIATYNRAEFLKEVIESITKQFKTIQKPEIIEVIVSDDCSSDDTKTLLSSFQKKYPQVKYYRNKKNLGAEYNMDKVGYYAKGEYIWFFSDDDMYKKDSIKTVLEVIHNYKPEVIIPNMDLYTKDGQTLIDSNLLRNDKDVFIKTKKEFFSYLETKFFLPFDWHIGVYSNTIVRRDLFRRNGPKVLIYNGFLNPFAHTSLFYYFPDDFKIYLIAKSLVKFRADNRSFGPKDRIEFLAYWYPILNRHYKIICDINRRNISLKFRFLLAIKKIVRNMRLLLLNFIKIDIAAILMKLFYKDARGKQKDWSISA